MSNWIAGNRYLSQAEMKNNVDILYDYFARRGWQKQSMAAMFGNMQHESFINPGIWESLTPYSGGFGLVQWTPYTKFSSWAGSDWLTAYDKQPQRIQYELDHGLQWEDYRYGTATPGLTFAQFAYNENPGLGLPALTRAFMEHYENPAAATANLAARVQYASNWFEYILPKPEPAASTIPIWLLFKIRWKRMEL